jgi:hypothetical protein
MSRVQYTRAFLEDVQGTLKARFRLDARGEPLWDEDEEGYYYFIQLRLESPNRVKIDKVTYVLDSTYYDPVRVSKDRDNDFAEEISSYGDYVLTVRVQMGKHLYVQEAWLSTLLEAGHAGEADTGPIRDAIEDIKAN